ncbi:MAG: helix-turn-helix domain-containing protein [Vulcanisaeta sp.]
MSSKLSRTEELAAKLYFNEGLKPKEIAQKLGISVNTVYKAISKYRAFAKNVDQESNGDQAINNASGKDNMDVLFPENYVFNVKLSIITTQPLSLKNNEPPEGMYQGELINEIRALRELVSKLVEKVEELERRSICVHSSTDDYDHGNKGNTTQSDYSVPDFLRDNPWVDVIKSIHSTS